ncbi:hypothetical protein C8Q79DRAFT_984581, partial [Trametes meyenii]
MHQPPLLPLFQPAQTLSMTQTWNFPLPAHISHPDQVPPHVRLPVTPQPRSAYPPPSTSQNNVAGSPWDMPYAISL